jgi:ubiquinone/menaquinone biosynthesis C-methylase UbiE
MKGEFLTNQPPCMNCMSTSYHIQGEALGFDPPHNSYSLTRCSQCGLIRTFPLMTDEELAGFYQLSYYTDEQKKFIGFIEKTVSFSSSLLAYSVMRRICPEARNEKIRPISVLEPGCGRGMLLKAFHNIGCECYGLERRDFPSKEIDKDIHFSRGDIYNMPYEEESFDLVILWYVLEHLANPLMALLESRRVLKKGGQLLVAVPNIASWQAKWFGRNWFHLDVPRHTVQFSETTLAQLIEKAGFKTPAASSCAPMQSIFGFVQSVLNWMFGIKYFNRFFFRIKKCTTVWGYLELGVWFLFFAALTPLAFVEYVVVRRTKHSALIKIYALK